MVCRHTVLVEAVTPHSNWCKVNLDLAVLDADTCFPHK